MQAPCPEIYILDAKCLSGEVLPPIQKKEQSRRRQPTVPSNMHSLPPEVQSHGQTTGQFLNSSRESVVGAAIVLDRHAYYNNNVCRYCSSRYYMEGLFSLPNFRSEKIWFACLIAVQYEPYNAVLLRTFRVGLFVK